MSRTLHRVVLIFAAIGAVLPIGSSARAYQCLEVDPRTALGNADGAFIGQLIAHSEPRRTGINGEVTLRFRVEEAVKGPFDTEVSVRGDGIPVRIGERTGLLLERRGNVWTSGLCSRMDPNVLRQAAAPLPAPDSNGPVSFLVGARFGDSRAMALDRDGGIVAYGRGEGIVASFGVCDGSGRVVEAVWHPASRVVEIAVRAVATLELFRESRVEELDGWFPSQLSCRDAAGDDVYVAARDDALRIVRMRNGSGTVVYDGPGRGASFSSKRDVAYLTAQKSILEVEMRSGRTRVVTDLPLTPISVVPNADDSVLAGTNGGSGPKGRVFTVDRRSGKVSLGRPASYGDPIWLSRDVFVVDPSEGTVRAFDAHARPLPFPGQIGDPAVAGGGTLFSVSAGALTAKDDESVRLVRSFDKADIRALAYVPSGPTRGTLPNDLRPGPLALVLGVLALGVAFGLRRAAAARHRG